METLITYETSDDACGILLRFEDGVRGAVTISQVSADAGTHWG